MKIEKLRELGLSELQHKLGELQNSLLQTKIKVQTKQVENTAQLGIMRRDIARILTLLKQMEGRGAQTPPATEPSKTATPPAQPEKLETPAKTPKAEKKAEGKAEKRGAKATGKK